MSNSPLLLYCDYCFLNRWISMSNKAPKLIIPPFNYVIGTWVIVQGNGVAISDTGLE